MTTLTNDQILAMSGLRGPLAPHQAEDVATFVRRMCDELPDVKAAVIGRVLLQAAGLYSAFATNNHRTPISVESAVAVRMLGEAGERLYLAGERP